MKTICFDLDGVICTNTWGDYKNAKPIFPAINKVNSLYNNGFKIIIFTARYMGRNNEDINKANIEGYEFTKNQLTEWGLKFHKLLLGKPSYDLFVDDKSINFDDKWYINFEFKN